MSAELLREAAAKMRERARAAVPGAWESSANSDDQYFVYGINLEGEVSAEIFVHDGTRRAELDASAATAEFIASWHPAVALAVADWLAVAADHWDNSEHVVHTIAYTDGPEDECDEECPACQREEAATEVARAYLGRPE